ncbi:MAG: endonuclease [Phycisphaerae bacterium]
MTISTNRLVTLLFAAALGAAFACPASAQYDPPAGYYDAATGTGVTLKNQLSAIMTAGHIQQTYGAFRFAAANYDQDPNNPSNILLVYNRASVSSNWDSGATWNREHVWPQSRQPGSANNSSTGNLGDPLALRPANPSINSSRGNKPFGNFTTTGPFGSQGTFYFPGDADKGDTARNLFYSATRYQSTGLTLVNGVPSGNQMGDLQSLLRWHYTDPPDDFERRRNHVIFGVTHNRNAFIDRPEFVWSVFGGGANDSTLFVGGAPAGDGSSGLTIDLGPVLVGAAVPGGQSVTVNKTGADPTYYAVLVAGNATSDVLGNFNAFDFDPQSTAINVGLSGATTTPGLLTGTVTIDNLDVDGAASGQGSLDGDDVVTINLAVLDHAEASFNAAVDQDTLTIDFGTVPAGSGTQNLVFTVYNLDITPGFTAALDLDAISGSGDTAVLTTDLAPTANLSAGTGLTFNAFFDTTSTGAFSAQYTITVSDENLSGALAGLPLTLNLTGQASTACDACDADCDGFVTLADVSFFVDMLINGTAPCSTCAGDTNAGGSRDGADVQSFVQCLVP